MSGAPTIDLSHLEPSSLMAQELRGVFNQGTSRPLHVRCARLAPATGEVDVVLKLRDPQVSAQLPWHLGLARELTGSILARRAGLSVPEYGIVTVTDSFAQSVRRSPEGGRIAANLGPNFGSAVITPILEMGARDPSLWAGPLTFDALLLNGDRKAVNRNALFDGSQLYLIDHSLVAPTWQLDANREPDTVLFGASHIVQHAGYNSVRGQGVDYFKWSASCEVALDDKFLEWLKLRIPSSWLDSRETERLLTFLRKRKQIAPQQADELRTVAR